MIIPDFTEYSLIISLVKPWEEKPHRQRQQCRVIKGESHFRAMLRGILDGHQDSTKNLATSSYLGRQVNIFEIRAIMKAW